MAQAPVAVKRSIIVRKIAPRKTVAPSENDKENRPRSSVIPECTRQQESKQKISSPGTTLDHGSSSAGKKMRKAAMPSPILPSSPPPSSGQQQTSQDSEDAVWSQKVRRSYSRLSEKSFNSPDRRETLFGFEKLQTPEVGQRSRHEKTSLEASGSLCGLAPFTTLLEAADDGGSVFPEPDLNIPGVTVVKEKKRRKKVQQIDSTELNTLAAEMNAVFEEADAFELVVE